MVLPWFNLRLVTMGQEEVVFEPVSGVVTFFKSVSCIVYVLKFTISIRTRIYVEISQDI